MGERRYRAQGPHAAGGPPARLAPVPVLALEHAAADRPDQQRGAAARLPLEPGVGQRLARGSEREPVRPRASSRNPERGHNLRGHLGRDARAEALGVDQGDGLDRAGAGREAGPEALDARAVGAHVCRARSPRPQADDYRAANDYRAAGSWRVPWIGTARSRAQAWPVFARMNRDRESSERNSSVRSSPSWMRFRHAILEGRDLTDEFLSLDSLSRFILAKTGQG